MGFTQFFESYWAQVTVVQLWKEVPELKISFQIVLRCYIIDNLKNLMAYCWG